MNATAGRKFFASLPEHEQVRYVELLRLLRRLKLGCRCERAGGQELVVIVGYGLATAQFWLDVFEIPD